MRETSTDPGCFQRGDPLHHLRNRTLKRGDLMFKVWPAKVEIEENNAQPAATAALERATSPEGTPRIPHLQTAPGHESRPRSAGNRNRQTAVVEPAGGLPSRDQTV